MGADGPAWCALDFQDLKPKTTEIKVSLTVKTNPRQFAGFRYLMITSVQYLREAVSYESTRQFSSW